MPTGLELLMAQRQPLPGYVPPEGLMFNSPLPSATPTPLADVWRDPSERTVAKDAPAGLDLTKVSAGTTEPPGVGTVPGALPPVTTAPAGPPVAPPPGVTSNGGRAPYTPFNLPGTDAAMGGLRGLQTNAVSGFDALIKADPAAARKAVQDAMYESQAEGINRQADKLGRGLEESAFGRGVGLSSIALERSKDLDRERFDALGRANREAFIGAGNETRADTAARTAALGTAFNAGTSGLQGEANVGLNNAARTQGADQFGANLDFQESQNALNRNQNQGQFDAGLGLQNRQLDLNERGQNIAGVAAGLGGLANFFGPTLKAGQTVANAGLQTLFK